MDWSAIIVIGLLVYCAGTLNKIRLEVETTNRWLSVLFDKK